MDEQCSGVCWNRWIQSSKWIARMLCARAASLRSTGRLRDILKIFPLSKNVQKLAI